MVNLGVIIIVLVYRVTSCLVPAAAHVNNRFLQALHLFCIEKLPDRVDRRMFDGVDKRFIHRLQDLLCIVLFTS